MSMASTISRVIAKYGEDCILKGTSTHVQALWTARLSPWMVTDSNVGELSQGEMRALVELDAPTLKLRDKLVRPDGSQWEITRPAVSRGGYLYYTARNF